MYIYIGNQTWQWNISQIFPIYIYTRVYIYIYIRCQFPALRGFPSHVWDAQGHCSGRHHRHYVFRSLPAVDENLSITDDEHLLVCIQISHVYHIIIFTYTDNISTVYILIHVVYIYILDIIWYYIIFYYIYIIILYCYYIILH